MYIHIYIYIYVYREIEKREREREILCVYVYIYIYVWKVYIGPGKYFVTSDVGDGRIQWSSEPPKLQHIHMEVTISIIINIIITHSIYTQFTYICIQWSSEQK